MGRRFNEEEPGDMNCPHCGEEEAGLVCDDYTTRHQKEVLLECDKCDKLYKVYYKFERIVKLEEGV